MAAVLLLRVQRMHSLIRTASRLVLAAVLFAEHV